MTGFEVVMYPRDRATIQPHTCREPNCAGGLSYDEACQIVAEHYEQVAKEWRLKTHPEADFYNED